MKRVQKKELKRLKEGGAIDVTNYNFKQCVELHKRIDKQLLYYSCSSIGLTGLAFEDIKTGQLYVILMRSMPIDFFC